MAEKNVEEVRVGSIIHRVRKVSKGIEMLRLERKLKPVLEEWRKAVRENPDQWK
jgi:ribosomal protein L30/L7E